MQPSSVPADHRFRSDEDEGLLPTGPSAASNYPEQPVEWSEPWSRMPTLQYRELLAEGQILQEKAATTAEDASECAQQEPEEAKHEPDLYQTKWQRQLPILLISKLDRVLANHNALITVGHTILVIL